MSVYFHPDGSISADTGEEFSVEFAAQHHPTEEDRRRRYLVEQPMPSGGLLKKPVRLWVLPQHLAVRHDYRILREPEETVELVTTADGRAC